MEDTNIKQEIIDLCDDFVAFWKQFKDEVNTIADDDDAELVLKWRGYFVEHNDTIWKLTKTKLHAEEIERHLIECGVLKLVD